MRRGCWDRDQVTSLDLALSARNADDRLTFDYADDLIAAMAFSLIVSEVGRKTDTIVSLCSVSLRYA
jgi:hypothetical protein